MVSNIRRKVRRYLLGATQKATRVRWIGEVTVRVMSPSQPLASARSTRTLREKANHGAEKSCLTRRRRRGLRKKKGSREPHPAEPNSSPANVVKSQSSRKVNHSGRKFLWAVKASNQLRKDCEKYNKFPRGPLDPLQGVSKGRTIMKQYCMAKWSRLHMRAQQIGLHPTVAFHKTFWDYLLIETSRGTPLGLEPLLEHLRISVMDPEYFHGRPATVIRHGRGNRRACRMCGYVGAGPHEWGNCRRTEPQGSGSRRGASVRRKGGTARIRPCGCKVGAKCPH